MELYQKELIDDRKKIAKYRVLEITQFIKNYKNAHLKDFNRSLLIESLRAFTKDIDRYIFILDFQGTQILHHNRELEGKNRLHLKDKNGFRLIENIINVSKNSQGGFTTYYSTIAPKDKLSYKISYSKSIEPLGWVIGSGVYLDNISDKVAFYEASILSTFREDVIQALIILMVILLFVWSSSLYLYRYLQKKLIKQQYLIESKSNNLEALNKEMVQRSKQKDLLLYEQAKLAYMGENFGGIVHQWRQTLSRIISQASVLSFHNKHHQMHFEDVSKHLDDIVSNTKYLSQTIEDFRKFMVNDPAEYQEINAIVHQALNLFEPIAHRENIKMDFVPFEHQFYISQDFIHPLLNLLNNSKDAFNAKVIENKRISISGQKEKSHLLITFTDNAGGIDEYLKGKIFDYGVSTKNDNGLGMGLYISKNILEKRLNSYIEVEDFDNGSRFSIYIRDFAQIPQSADMDSRE